MDGCAETIRRNQYPLTLVTKHNHPSICFPPFIHVESDYEMFIQEVKVLQQTHQADKSQEW